MSFDGGGEFEGAGGGSTGGGGGSGTVTGVSVVSANGFAGTVANPTTTPAITLTTTVTGVLKGNGTTVSAAVAGTDYSVGTSALATGLLKSTTGTGALSIAAAGTDYIAGPLTGDVTTVGNAATLVGTANVESIIRANSLDQLTAPAGNVSFNNHRLVNQAAAIVSTDSATVGQLVGTSMPYVVSGCVWTADSPGTNRNCSMTSGTVMIGNILLTVAAVTARTFTASNDTYVDFQDNGDGTATITYTAVPNFQQSPALANSGTALNTIRNAVVSVGASSVATAGIGQGALAVAFGSTVPTQAGTQGSTTVAAGSNTHAITATPLLVAAVTNFASGAGYALWTSAATGEQALLGYTGTTAGSINGITVLAGRAAATVATGDSVVAAWPVMVADSIGNPINPYLPTGGLISSAFILGTVASTATNNGVFLLGPTNAPSQILFSEFVVPPGPARTVRLTLQMPTITSSAAAGTQLDINIGQATSGGGLSSWGDGAPKVKVASDGDALQIVAHSTSRLAAGTYALSVSNNAGAAGTLTYGRSLTQTVLTAQFV